MQIHVQPVNLTTISLFKWMSKRGENRTRYWRTTVHHLLDYIYDRGRIFTNVVVIERALCICAKHSWTGLLFRNLSQAGKLFQWPEFPYPLCMDYNTIHIVCVHFQQMIIYSDVLPMSLNKDRTRVGCFSSVSEHLCSVQETLKWVIRILLTLFYANELLFSFSWRIFERPEWQRTFLWWLHGRFTFTSGNFIT